MIGPLWGQAAGNAGMGTDADQTFKLGRVQIMMDDIYPGDTANNAIRQLLDATHWRTREFVIRREIWLDPGDDVDVKFAQELERNLRSLGLFAQASVKLVPGESEHTRDLVIRTRDRLSLGAGVGASFVGNAASGNASLSESNLLGTGDLVQFSLTKNDFGRTRGQVSYRDRYVAGTWTTAEVFAGRTDEGDFFGASFNRPFRHLEDHFSWNLSVGKSAFARNYFFANRTVAEVPIDRDRASASVSWRSGSRMNFWTRGLTARYENNAFRAARGQDAASIRLPGDTKSVFTGATLSWADLSVFRKVQNLDTIRFIQDVQVGSTAFLEAGAYVRDEAEGGTAPDGDLSTGQSSQSQITTRLARTFAPGETRYLSARLSGSMRTDGSDVNAWRTDVDLRAFDLSFHPHTLGLGLSYTQANETQGLPVQLTLGESSGLRGYPNREFVGDRVFLINLEDRIDLDASFRSFDFGAVIFADAGWIGNDQSFEGPFTSAGFGLRIGSTPLLGRGVLRVDLAFPFDDANGKSFSPLLSLTLGQVFTL